MADIFPTALQRTSDERWVSLDVVAHSEGRGVARVVESPSHAAVVHTRATPRYDTTLRALLQSPPPHPGRGVHISWPVDLLHDLDGAVIGFTARRHRSGQTWPLADFLDPVRRTEIAPMTTRRHLLRVARNTATAMAALHHVGHAGLHRRQFRINDRGQVIVVRVDDLIPHAEPLRRTEDERRLAKIISRLLAGHSWAATGELAELLARDTSDDPVGAQQWYFALREAEEVLARTPGFASAPAPPTPPPTLTTTAAGAQDESGHAPRPPVGPADGGPGPRSRSRSRSRSGPGRFAAARSRPVRSRPRSDVLTGMMARLFSLGT